MALHSRCTKPKKCYAHLQNVTKEGPKSGLEPLT